mgnify:CR=1 FL=1
MAEDFKIFFAVRNEDKTRYFDDIDEVRALPKPVKQELIFAANEVDQIRPVDIKNLRSRLGEQTVPAANTKAPTTVRSTKGSRGSGSRKNSIPGGFKR